MLKTGFNLFTIDIAANSACWRNRVFWFFLFLRCAQYVEFSPVRLICKFCKKIVLMGTCCELPASAIVGGGYISHT